MDEVLLDRGEGLCVKNPQSMYFPGERPITWLKLKPDYISSLGEHIDAVILAAFYGSGDTSHVYSIFSIGVLDDRNPDGDLVFAYLSQVGTGCKRDELTELYNLLSPRAKN